MNFDTVWGFFEQTKTGTPSEYDDDDCYDRYVFAHASKWLPDAAAKDLELTEIHQYLT